MNARAAPAAVTACRVIFGDTDAGGIVYHPRYLEMAERGRNECMRAAGLDPGGLFEHRRLGLALRSVGMKFHAPALFDDYLTIRTALGRLGPASSTWLTHIRRGGTLICTVRAEIVCMDRRLRRPVLYPEDLRCAFERTRSGAPGRGREAER